MRTFLRFLFRRDRGAATPEPRSTRQKPKPGGDAPAAGPERRNFDSEDAIQVILVDHEEDVLYQMEEKVRAGNFELPQLPSTSIAVMGLANDPSTEVSKIAGLIAADPVLSSELVKTANSALYTGGQPITSIQDGIVRLGLRALRSLILGVSLRSTLFGGHGLMHFAEEVWRQSVSVARIARVVGPRVGVNADKAFLLGLLHDVGKVPLLSLLRDEEKGSGISRVLVGKAFYRLHETAGRALAGAWQLGDELVSVAGCHHRFRENTDFGESAALVSLAHRLDLYQSLHDEDGYAALVRTDEMEALGVAEADRYAILESARETYHAGRLDSAA